MAVVKDPVCGRELNTEVVDRPVRNVPGGAPEVDPAKGTRSFHDGKWYFFCSLACRTKFSSNPAQYLK